MPIDRDVVATLIAEQGFVVPRADLDEIHLIVERMIQHALDWDALDPSSDEPWTHWPEGRE